MLGRRLLRFTRMKDGKDDGDVDFVDDADERWERCGDADER